MNTSGSWHNQAPSSASSLTGYAVSIGLVNPYMSSEVNSGKDHYSSIADWSVHASQVSYKRGRVHTYGTAHAQQHLDGRLINTYGKWEMYYSSIIMNSCHATLLFFFPSCGEIFFRLVLHCSALACSALAFHVRGKRGKEKAKKKKRRGKEKKRKEELPFFFLFFFTREIFDFPETTIILICRRHTTPR